MKGRATGSPELDEAREVHRGAVSRRSGFSLFGEARSCQPFPITVGATARDQKPPRATDGSGPDQPHARRGVPAAEFLGERDRSGEVVFAGYGITAREYGYDDYAGLDVKDKLVLVLRHEPQEFDEKSVFSGRVYTNHAQLESKALNARLHGARAVLFVSDKPTHPNETEDLAGFFQPPGPGQPRDPLRRGEDGGGRPLAAAGRALADGGGEGIDRNLRPRSFALPGSLPVELATDVRQEARTVQQRGGLPARREPTST